VKTNEHVYKITSYHRDRIGLVFIGHPKKIIMYGDMLKIIYAPTHCYENMTILIEVGDLSKSAIEMYAHDIHHNLPYIQVDLEISDIYVLQYYMLCENFKNARPIILR